MRNRALLVCLLLAACGPDQRRDDGTGGGSGGGGPIEGVDAFSTGDPNGQNILMLDFRSGWWAGSAGDFHKTVLDPLRNSGTDVTIEFHHLTVGSDVKCIYAPNAVQHCENATMSNNPTPAEVVARFDRHSWNEYTQVWILSGSEKDMSDIRVSGDLFGHFIAEGGTSCIPLFIGAGDGFIDHANALATSLGIGQIMTTEYANPGFFFGTSNVTIDSKMMAGMNMTNHELFTGVNEIADGVANPFLQHTHGDALVNNSMVQIIATDSAGRQAMGVGSILLSDGNMRPFVIDAGMQRYYGSVVEPDTLKLLLNIRKYLATHGCRAIIE